MNKALILGNLGADPELRTATNGTPVCTMRVATTERTKEGEHTEWHSVVCFGKTAENVARFLKKGRKVMVEGRIQTRKWTDKEGKERWSTEIVAFHAEFIDGGGGKPAASSDDEIPF